MENELHKRFATRAVNLANLRKEFFFASAAEVRDALAELVGTLLDYTDHEEATAHLQSISGWPVDVALGPQA